MCDLWTAEQNAHGRLHGNSEYAAEHTVQGAGLPREDPH